MQKEEFLTTLDVAAACGVSTMSITRWCEGGKGPPHHRTPGNQRRFKKADVVSWMRAKGMPVPSTLEVVHAAAKR